MEERNTKIMEEYIDFVSGMIDKFKKVGDLVSSDSESVTPEKVNTALAYYYSMSMALNAEYQRVKINHLLLSHEFEAWQDSVFEEARLSIMQEYADTKSIKPSVKEFETRARTLHAEEYTKKQTEVEVAESKMRFLLRMLETLKSYDSILTTISSNMRMEMRALSLDDRMNAVPDGVNPNKIREGIGFPEKKVRVPID